MELIKKAITDKKASWDDVEEKVKKILRAKYWSGLNKYESIDLNNLHADLNNATANVLRETLYENAMTVVQNNNELLPI